MPAGATYTPIATTTLVSAANSYTFTSIPSTYTDLVIVVSGQLTAEDYPVMQFNGDTGSNYSDMVFRGNGTTAAGGASANRVFISVSSFGASTGAPFVFTTNLMNYKNTTTYKTTLSRWANQSQETNITSGTWRSTAAITSVKVYGLTGQTFTAGTIFTLYGIAAA
jgi:hypothetical protein